MKVHFYRCAFVNTPKFNQVKGKGKIVTMKWIEACFTEQKKIPWRRFATDRDEKKGKESDEEIHCKWNKPQTVFDSDSGGDNNNDDDDDEDMVVIDKRKIKVTTEEKKKSPEKVKKIDIDNNKDDSDDDDMVVVDKRIAKISPSKMSIEKIEKKNDDEILNVEEEQKENFIAEFDSDSSIDITAIECQVFKNKIFYLNEDLPSSTQLKFSHIIRNMLGVLTKDPSKANYIITKQGKNLPKTSGAEVVKDIWIQECHDLQAFIPTMRYKL